MKKILAALLLVSLSLVMVVSACANQPTPVTNVPPAPLAQEEIFVGEDYPYMAQLPPELEGKMELAYNYGFDEEGKHFLVKRRWTILSRIEHIQIHEAVIDGKGKDISTHTIPAGGNNVSLYYGFGIGPFNPGDIVTGKTKGNIIGQSNAPLTSWTVEEKITYYRLP